MAGGCNQGATRVTTLAFLQAVYISSMSIILTVTALNTIAMGGTKSQSTFAFTVLATGLGTSALMTPRLVKRIGYRASFMLANGVCILSGSIGTIAILAESIPAILVSSFLFGLFQGTANYYRYAAADGSGDSEEKQRRVYIVLAGGVVAAVVGPELLKMTKSIGTDLNFMPYLFIVASGALGFLISGLGMSDEGLKLVSDASSRTNAWRSTLFWAGSTSTLIGYFAMTLVMTAGPLAAAEKSGNHVISVPVLMQVHFLGMFAPMLLLAFLAKWLGSPTLVCAGVTIGAAGGLFPVFLSDSRSMLPAMALAGVSWAVTYGTGSGFLATAIASSGSPLTRGLGELCPALGLAAGALLAGPLLAITGWVGVNATAAVSLIMLLGFLLTLFSLARLSTQTTIHQ